MIIDVMPGLTRLLARHLASGPALAVGLALASACIAVGTAAAGLRAGAFRRPGRRPRRPM